MSQLSSELEAIGTELRRSYARRLRRRRVARTATAVGALAAALAVAAGAATGDLELDPTKWQILGSGSVDDGRGEFVHAKRLDDGRPSTFMVEHDAGMDRYQAFLLHERLKNAADESSPVPVETERGAVCTPDQLTRAEQTALDALRAGGSAEAAVTGAFADEPCRGLAYAAEIAARVFGGDEPVANLMPGVE